MKIINTLFYTVVSFFWSTISVIGCPTCVGRIKAESPPFFSAEFYQPGNSIQRQTKEQIAQAQFKKLLDAKREKK